MDILKGIRPLDYVLTAVMVALAAFIGLENVNLGADADLAHRLDSQSALMIPVFVLAALPILWRRRNILAVIAVSFVVTAASVPMFGWVTRCGWALPLSIAMAYAVARFAGSQAEPPDRPGRDPGAADRHADEGLLDRGPRALSALGIPLAAVFYGIGFFVQTRAEKSAAAPTLDAEHVHA